MHIKRWRTTACRAALTAMAVIAMTAGGHLAAQQAAITGIVIKKKPGEADGRAVARVRGPVNVKGKLKISERTGRIATHALEAWTIMNGQGALLLLSPEKSGHEYRLRYYQLDVSKGRLLGRVPFAAATMMEAKAAGAPWAFAVSGVDPSTKHPVIFVGDSEAILAQLDNASAPKFSGDTFSFLSAGKPTTIKITDLLGEEAYNHIYAPSRSSSQTAYLQFLPTGEALATTAHGQVESGRWTTDGETFRVIPAKGPAAVWRLSDLEPVTGVPAGSRLNVRLLQPLSSRTARKGMAVKAVLISPGVFGGSILIPQGSEFDGHIVESHGVGWGVRHETAALTVHFDLVKLPDGRTLQIDARVFEVENSRESVSQTGTIEGVRATGTIGYSAENQITSLAQIDPIGYLFTAAMGPAMLGFAQPEILYNAGTELDIEFNKPLITSQQYKSRIPQIHLPGDGAGQFSAMIRELPFRTRTATTHTPSDITNLVFIGEPGALRRALTAAGWSSADTLTAAATFETIKTLAGNETYTQAPMSTLILGDEKPIFTMEKSTDTFSSRHHIRVFDTGETFEGEPVLTASSTQDIGIAFSSRQKTFIHVIDQYLDNERSKVTNDLELTGCVDSLDLAPRPWVPRDAYNSTGDRLITDGDVAVMWLNECRNPYATPTTAAARAPFVERSERDTMLTIKDTLYRGNVVYTGISWGIKAHRYLAGENELGEQAGDWRRSDASGTTYRVAGVPKPLLKRNSWSSDEPTVAPDELTSEAQAEAEAHKWDPPHFELALNLGYSNYLNHQLEEVIIFLTSTNPNNPTYFLGLGDAVYDGWAASTSLTLNSWNWVSNEFSYQREQTKFILVGFSIVTELGALPPLDVQTVGWTTRRFAYNTVLNLRPRRSRWRPYIAAGPAFQLLALASAPLKKPSGYFRLGLSNIGLLKAAIDFGSTPPLNGGGIYQFGLQYGGGFKYRVTPRFMIRTDFGETWSANPKVIKDSYAGYIPTGLDNTYTTFVGYSGAPAHYLQIHSTVGFAFTF